MMYRGRVLNHDCKYTECSVILLSNSPLREKTEYSIIFAKVFVESFAGFRGGLVSVFGLFCVGSLHEQEKRKDRVMIIILILILYDRKHPWTYFRLHSNFQQITIIIMSVCRILMIMTNLHGSKIRRILEFASMDANLRVSIYV